jgi:hypothetical protein
MSAATTIAVCGVTADGRMSVLSSSTTLVSKEGAINNRNGVDERGLILTKPFATTPTGTNPVTSGLILYLDATRTASYGGSGTTWNDISGASTPNPATLAGNPSFGSGSIANGSGSFTFNGDPGVFATTNQSNISLTTATFIAWVNPSAGNNNYQGLIFNRNGEGGSTAQPTGLNFRSNGYQVSYHWNNYDSYNSGLVVPQDQWSMIAVTISANKAVAYLCNGTNGIQSHENNVSHATVSNLNFFIATDPGGRSSSNNRNYKGKMGVAMIYNTTLSTQNITDIYNAQKAAFGL